MHLDLLSQDGFLQDLNCWATMANTITIIIIIIIIAILLIIIIIPIIIIIGRPS